MVERARRVFAAQFDALTALLALHPDVAQPPVSFEEYAWASGVVGTRTIWFPDAPGAAPSPHLVPLVDTVNCRQLERADAVHVTQLEAGAVVTRARHTFAAGAQLFENYGKTNAHYFWMHGFSIEPNDAFDCVHVPLAPDGEPATAETLCLSVSQLPATLAAYDGDGDAATDLVSLVDEHLARYATTAAQDEALLAAEAPADDADIRSVRRRAAIAFRLTEKRLLRAVRDELQRRIDNSGLQREL